MYGQSEPRTVALESAFSKLWDRFPGAASAGGVPPRSRPPARPAPRRAYTLVELIIATAASGLLVVGLASAVYIASAATASSGTPAPTLEAAQVAATLAEELRYAIFVTGRGAQMIEFALPDINDDGQEDVIRYQWSGTPGDPLLRTFNHGTPQTVAEDVQHFELVYRYRDKMETFDEGLQESGEVTLSELAGGGSTSDYQVRTDQWVGQCFAPSLPAEAVSWSLARIDLSLRRSGMTDGQFKVQIRPATGNGRPTSTVLEEVIVSESSLSSRYQWKQYALSNVKGLSPSERLCVVIEHVAGATACEARCQSADVNLADHGLLESSDQGPAGCSLPTKGCTSRPKGPTPRWAAAPPR